MPLRLSWFERQIFLHRHWGPGPILDAFGILAFKAVYTAVKLGVFDALASRGPAMSADLARTLHADEKGLSLILHALEATGYVARTRRGIYSNSAMTRKWMLAGGEAQLAGFFGYFDDTFQRWSTLDGAVRGQRSHGPGDILRWLDEHPGSWQRYHGGLRSIAALVAPQVARAASLPSTARRIIDIGGSHGLYSALLCRKFPALSAVILDREQAGDVARRTTEDMGMQDRISFVTGDIMEDTPPGTYDAALLVNTLRCFDKDRAPVLFSRIRDLLNPGGMVLIADQFRLPTRTPFSRLNATMILLELYNGSAFLYNDRETMDMLRKAGFADVRLVKLRRTPGIHMVTGRRV